MGFWTKAAGVGLAVAGGLTAQPELIGAGAGMVVNDIRSEAAKKANAQQQSATDKAQGTLTNVYNQSRADFNPYIQTGTSAMSSLGDMVGLPRASQTATVNGTINGMNSPATTAETALQQGMGNAAQPQQAIARNPTAAQAQTGSSYAMVKAPNGQVGQVPTAMLQKALAMGGQLVEGQ